MSGVAGRTGDGERLLLREVADRLALRELVDTYAQAVDRRLPEMFAALFHEDGQLIIPHPAGGDRPPLVLDGHGGWDRAFAAVAPFTVTSHFVGNHLVQLGGDRATGETCCLVHEVYEQAGTGTARIQLRLARYTDRYLRHEGRWVFRSRALRFDWHDDRPLGPPRDPYREARTGLDHRREPQS